MTTNLYFIIYCLAIILLINHKVVPVKLFKYFWVICALVFSYIIRRDIAIEEDGDIAVYANYMIDDYFDWGSPKFLREFLFWSLVRTIQSITQDINASFMVLDLILFILIYLSFNSMRNKYFPKVAKENTHYLCFACLIFFPYLVGFNLLYRQLFASLIFIYALGLTAQNRNTAIFLFIVSGFFHNVIFLFAPILLRESNIKFYKYISVLLLALVPLGLIISETSEAEFLMRHEIYYANKLSVVILFAIGFITVIGITINRLSRKAIINKNNNFLYIYLFLIILFSFTFLERSLSTERIGQLIFCVLFLVLSSEAFRDIANLYLCFSFINKSILGRIPDVEIVIRFAPKLKPL